MVKNNSVSNNCSDQLTPRFPELNKLAVELNFEPVNSHLFVEALTHSSYANEQGTPSNERLEFLGDSVLSLIVCNFLYSQYPSAKEGELAKLKAIMVSSPILARLARQTGLDRYIKLGQGELQSNGNSKPHILADLFEAFIGAYFLNFGFEATTGFLMPLIKPLLPEIASQSVFLDAKSSFQELAQSMGFKPEYRIIREEGPPHERIFTVEVWLNNEMKGQGTGRTLKEAQNQAARAGLIHLRAL
ncbi:MAG: ribonuclease III [Firmicutes bacterium]|nr:ribonuclease III [Bacillota bacterium]